MIISDFVIVICLILSAFFSGMEIAFVSSNRIYLEIEKLQGSFTSRVLKSITQNPSRFIACMLLGNNIALVIYGIFASHQFEHETLSGKYCFTTLSIFGFCLSVTIKIFLTKGANFKIERTQ